MQQKSDAELLREYAVRRSEAAFGEIVRRYADLVYSVAVRQLGNETQARDVAQMVFVDLARKAGELRGGTVLIGWLHRAARLAALEQWRADQRRAQRERQAMELFKPSDKPTDDWSAIGPKLDEAIASLGDEDRVALLMRFFRNQSLADVGAALGISEDAAQKRVSRALDRLREWLSARGVHTATGALSAALMANAVQSAPAGWAVSLASGALAGNAKAAGATWSLFPLTPMKTALVMAPLIAGLVMVTLSRSNAERELREVRAQLEEQRAISERLAEENERLAGLQEELARARADARELLQLRAEVGRLRLEQASAAAVLPEPDAAVHESDVAAPNIQIEATAVLFPGSSSFRPEDNGVLAEPLLRGWVETYINNTNLVTRTMRVLIASGRQAHLSINIESGRTLELEVIASSEANSPVIMFDQATGVVVGTARPDSVAARAELFSLPEAVSVWDGQGLYFTRAIPSPRESERQGSDSGRPVVIFLGATLLDPAGNRLDTSQMAMEANTASNQQAIPSILPETVPGGP